MKKIPLSCPKGGPQGPNSSYSYERKRLQKQAFTLVELIVVITILAILGTIAFISLQGYSRDARDSTRMADITSIETQLELFSVKSGTLPIPENNIELISSGVTIGYQGYADQQTLNILKVNNGGFDPVDNSPYVYRINGNKNSYQIMGFLENGNQLSYQVPSPERGGLGRGFIPQANAATDLTNRFPISKGKVLGIMLEQTTNNPLQDIKTGIINLRTDTTLVDTYLTNTIIKSGQIKDIYGTMENLASSQKFDKPQKDCPTGFIPVPGNMDFGQPAFCASKYEMTYSDANTPNSSGGDWNTVSYIGGKVPVSMAGKFPIADIKQQQAIDSCKAIGPGYHLITNNEWMSLARDIEKQGVNWSSGQVGSGFIYNGVSNNNTLGCSINRNLQQLQSPLSGTLRTWATTTGDATCTNQKNKLILSNQEQIWDLSGNIWEHVNKTNTLDGTNSASGITSIAGSSNGTIWDDDGKYNKSDMNKYGSILGYGTAKGMGNLYYADGVANNIFLRGGAAYNSSHDGVFALHLRWSSGSKGRDVGFRCAR